MQKKEVLTTITEPSEMGTTVFTTPSIVLGGKMNDKGKEPDKPGELSKGKDDPLHNPNLERKLCLFENPLELMEKSGQT